MSQTHCFQAIVALSEIYYSIAVISLSPRFEDCAFSLPYVLFVFLVISHFGFEGGTLVLIASVPGHCLYFTFETL